jgi:tetratricopeptide (TPR) repeat protein
MTCKILCGNLLEIARLATVIVIIIVGETNGQGLPKNTITSKGTVFYKAGIAKYKMGDYKGALWNFDSALANEKKDSKVYYWKGKSEQNLDNNVDAMESFNAALLINKNDTLSYKELAESKRLLGKYKECIPDYNTALALDPNDGNMHFGRASAYYELKEYNKSSEDYSFVIKKYPKFALAYMGRALSYIGLKKYSYAQSNIGRYFQLGGKDEGALYIRGLVKTRLGENNVFRLDSAIADLIRYTQSKDEAKRKDAMAYQTLGIAYSKKGDSTNSRRYFRISLQLDSTNADTYGRWGATELIFNNPKKANELLSKARKMTDSPSKGLLLNYGIAKTGIGDTIAAVNNFAEALKQDTTLYDAYERRVVFLFNNKKYTKMVLSDLQHMIELSQKDIEKAEGHSDKSMVAMHVNDTLTARLEVEKAIKLMPGEPFHYMVRAFLNANLNKNQTVILWDIDKSINLDPNLTEAYLFKATYYSKQGNHRSGCESLKSAIRTGSNVSKEVEDYICKGKKPKDGRAPELFIPVSPRLMKISDNKYED